MRRTKLMRLADRARSWRDGSISFAELNETVEAARKLDPSCAEILAIAYEAAVKENSAGRRLFYAMELARATGTSAHRIAYGVECIASLMPERAEKIFATILQAEPNNIDALNGMGRSLLSRMKPAAAEDYIRKSLTIAKSEEATKGMAEADRLRNPNNWTEKDHQALKFWRQWEDNPLDRMTDDERKRAMAKIVARRR